MRAPYSKILRTVANLLIVLLFSSIVPLNGGASIVQSSLVRAASIPQMRLPFSGTRTFTGGPHAYNGGGQFRCGIHNVGGTTNDTLSGIDFGLGNGTPVLAVAPGIVDISEKRPSVDGGVVRVVHVPAGTDIRNVPDGTFATEYWHVQDRVPAGLTEGAPVEAGTIIAFSGIGNGAEHLHLEFRISKKSGDKVEWIPYPAHMVVIDGYTVYSLVLADDSGRGFDYEGTLVKGTSVPVTGLYQEIVDWDKEDWGTSGCHGKKVVYWTHDGRGEAAMSYTDAPPAEAKFTNVVRSSNSVPNSDEDDYRRLRDRQTLRGTIEEPEPSENYFDVDTYLFDAREGDAALLIVKGEQDGLRPRVEVRAPDGKQFATGDAGSGTTATVRIGRIPATGNYTVAVHDQPGESSGPYTIRLELTRNCSSDEPKDNEVILYSEPGFGGACQILTESAAWLYRGSVGNNNTASIKVGGSVQAVLCDIIFYHGRCETFAAADDDLTDNVINIDATSSVRVETRAATRATYRIVLTWEFTPIDLDAHLWLPARTPYHVYYPPSARGSLEAFPWAMLDKDDQRGPGPETITIVKVLAGTYVYVVENYSRRMGNSVVPINITGARVVVYDGQTNRKLWDRTVPRNGDGDWWYAFELSSTGTIRTINEIRTTQPAPYTDPASYAEDVEKDADTGTSNGPTLELSRDSGSPGTSFVLVGSGFAPGDATVFWDDDLLVTAAVSDDGTFEVEATVPEHADRGSHTILAVGADDASVMRTFTVMFRRR